MAQVYQFGKFVLDVQEQMLTADGVVVHLPTKEFETLRMLVENNGRVLSKDEMMSAIWQDTFVEESNLAQYISRLRKILNVDGNQYIKTISKRGYRFSADVRTSESEVVIERNMRVKVGGKERPTLGEIKSVAVLPFRSLAARDDDEFLGLGIADALITQLTRSGQIITRPTASVVKFGTGDHDSVAVAELLNVDAILEGNYQRSDRRIRLTAQMLDAESGKTLWAESFNTEIDDIFDVQDQIAERIVNAFSQHYSAEMRAHLTKRYTENKAAYEEYLKGRVSFSKRTAAGLTNAIGHFEKAIEIDPLYALAYAGMAEAYQLLSLSDALDPKSAFPKAKAAVLRALELDDAIAEAHVALGIILMDFDWNWLGAELSLQKAIDLNPNDSASHRVYGTLLLRRGRIGDAIVELKKAQELDPLSPAINTWMGEAFAHLGQHDAAIRIHEETTRFAPDYLFAYYFLVQSYVSTGRFADAAEAARKAVELSDDMSLTRSASIFLKARMGDREGARSELRELIKKRETTYVSGVNIASGFAVLEETEDALRWLETAVVERDSNLTWLNVDREFDDLREDPRFRAIVRAVDLQDAGLSRVPVNEQQGTAGANRSPVRLGILAVAGLAAIVLGLAVYYYSRSGMAAPAKNTMIRLTDAAFDDAYPTFTKDGRIRFARFVEKNALRTYVMNIDGSGVEEQTEIPGMTAGLFSPDGRRVFYRKEPSSDTNLYLADADGSNERVMPFNAGNCQWSPDSKQLVFQTRSTDPSIPNNSDIFIYTIETGEIVPVVESPYFDSDPAFSPDGKSIVYVSDIDGNFDVYSRVVATGETKRLTYNLGHDSFPSYSPDGTQIVFNSDFEKENNDVYVMNLDGTGVRKITDGPGWDAFMPNGWSADGTQILLLSDQEGKENIYLMNFEPFEPALVTSEIEGDERPDGSYSPDGERIVYMSSNEIRIFEPGSQKDRLVYRTVAGSAPTFSPDGSRIVFQERIEDNTEICSVNVDGSGFFNLTRNPSRDMAPAYSPDGSRIAFSAARAAGTSTFEIYVMNADGSDQRMIFGDRAMSVGAAWSPDGKSIVFANDREDGRVGNFELFSISVDGGEPTRLTTRPKYDVEPAISPDGKRIAFVSSADGNTEIYLMNADGTGLLRLTRDVNDDLYPRWSPDGSRLIFTSNRSGKYRLYEIRF